MDSARQAKRNSSEVLSAAQVETLETANGPSRQASEAATVSPEVAREDEERRVLARDKMNQNHTLLGMKHMKQPNYSTSRQLQKIEDRN